MRGHIRQQGKGSWELKFDTGRDPVTGKRRIRYVTFRGTRRKAETELAKYLGQLGENTYIEPSKLTVALYLDRWLTDHAKLRVTPKTFERYAEIVRKHLVPALGDHPMGKLAPLHIQSYYAAALAAVRKRRLPDGSVREFPPLAARTVKHHHRILSQALKQAVRLRLIARNPAEDVDAPRPAKREMKTLDLAQTGALLKAIKHTRVYWPCLIALTTGMRRGEILALRWKNVDLEAPVVRVVESLEQTKEALRFKAPKTERSRAITLPTIAVDELRRLKRRQAEELLALGIRQTGDTLVCPKTDGEPMQPRSLTHEFAHLVRDLKDVPRVRFHDLRHTHISHLLAAGVHPKIVSERAGHASVSITLDVYSHVVPGMQADAASRIDTALRAHIEP